MVHTIKDPVQTEILAILAEIKTEGGYSSGETSPWARKAAERALIKAGRIRRLAGRPRRDSSGEFRKAVQVETGDDTPPSPAWYTAKDRETLTRFWLASRGSEGVTAAEIAILFDMTPRGARILLSRAGAIKVGKRWIYV
jgi:hypothetical protein